MINFLPLKFVFSLGMMSCSPAAKTHEAKREKGLSEATLLLPDIPCFTFDAVIFLPSHQDGTHQKNDWSD